MVKRNTRIIRAICWSLASKDEERCADLMQEVLLSLWRYRHTLRRDATAKDERNWVRWHCRSVWSHQQRRQQLPTVSLDALGDLPDGEADYHGLVEDLATGLDGRERNLLELFLQGYSIAEAGRLLGLGRKNAYRLYHEMVKKMRDNLNKQ